MSRTVPRSGLPGSSRAIRRCGIAIVGGGITGLATAYYLRRQQPLLSIALLEASRYWGGKIITERQEGRIVEWGPDSFLTAKPQALELAEELGLSDQIVSSIEGNSRTLVLRRGRLIPIPAKFFLLAPVELLPFWKSPLLSMGGKLSIFMERFRKPTRSQEDESIASFVRRRFGDEALEVLGTPLLAGIYMGDPEQLSMRSAFPQLVEMEQKHGSITAALKTRRPAASAGRSLFVSFRGGMETLPRALLSRLDVALCPETRVERLEKAGGGYRLLTDAGEVHSERVVLAVDAETAGQLLAASRSASELSGFRTVSSIAATLVYGPEVALPNAYGMIVPHSEGREIAAISFNSRKFPGRAAEGESMLRIFLGGHGKEQILEKDNDAVLRIVTSELRDILGITAAPRFARLVRWRKANPQYLVGHGERMQRIRAALASWPGVYLAGSAFGGIGVPDCVAQARKAADAILGSLATVQSESGSPPPAQGEETQVGS